LGWNQDAALREKYERALALAQGRQLDQAYQLTIQILSADPLYYEADVLRIALAFLLKKTGRDDPKNLLQGAKGRAPLGADIERDVQAMINRLTGATPVDIAEPVSISPYVRQKLALVVGIGEFKDPKINPLRFTVNDARALADTLRNECEFDSVQLLINADATTTNIRTALGNLANKAGPEDLVVIYISSHGSPQNLERMGINYIVTYDTEVNNLFGTALEMETVLDVVKRIEAQRVVAFLDTCYSGGTFKELPQGWVASSRDLEFISGLGIESIQNALRSRDSSVRIRSGSTNEMRKPQGVGRVIIASSRQNERSWEDERIQHGYFTYFLIEALKQKSPISVEELYEYLRTKVPERVRQEKGKEQHPTIARSKDGYVDVYIRDKIVDGRRRKSGGRP